MGYLVLIDAAYHGVGVALVWLWCGVGVLIATRTDTHSR